MSNYKNIDWVKCKKEVIELQREIICGYKAGNLDLVYELQEILVKTFSARALAVDIVTKNEVKDIPGVDGLILKTDDEKFQMILELENLSNYKANDLRKVSIDGSLKKLTIPTIKDRCVEALYVQALQPIAESIGDSYSFGYRLGRNIQDVKAYIINFLKINKKPKFVIYFKIKIDNHKWIMENIPMNKNILKELLKIFNKNCYTGISQSNIISPIITNMVLDGLQEEVSSYGSYYIRYLNNLLIIGYSTLQIFYLESKVNDFLNKRGLTFYETKRDTVSEEGFDFVGFNFRESENSILWVKPTLKSLKEIKKIIFYIFQNEDKDSFIFLIEKLNVVLNYWGNYYKYANSSSLRKKIDDYVYTKLFTWVCNKNKDYTKYFHEDGIYQEIDNKKSTLFLLSSLKREKYNKVDINKNPYIDVEYFNNRKN